MQMWVTITIFALLSTVTCHHHLKCLKGPYHKPLPSVELDLQECQLYSASSCCYANFTEKLTPSPMVKLDNFYWDRCGTLSKKEICFVIQVLWIANMLPERIMLANQGFTVYILTRCETYQKQIECFYGCSPHASHWTHPNSSNSILNVPLCQSFCDNWLEACSDDLTCVYNHITDWKMEEDGNHCKNACIPYRQMYENGTDFCQSSWGESFTVSNTTGHCLELNEKDELVMKTITTEESEESSQDNPSSQNNKQTPAEKDKEQEA